jgi:hypothetical protein
MIILVVARHPINGFEIGLEVIEDVIMVFHHCKRDDITCKYEDVTHGLYGMLKKESFVFAEI